VGVSTDAILWYGFSAKEDGEDAFSKPLGKLTAALTGDEDSDDSVWCLSEYLREKLGVVIGSHCHVDYPVYFLAIESTKVRVWRGDAVEVSTSKFDDSWDEKLRQAAELIGFKADREKPCWLMASYWSG
jgi:hypothetical protein